MKRFRKSLIFGVAIALVLIAAVPALAAPRVDTVSLQIDNHTGSSVQLTLNGPGETSKLFVESNSHLKVEVVPGAYLYRYAACGHAYAGTFTAIEGKILRLAK